MSGCQVSQRAVWLPGMGPDADALCGQVPAQVTDLGEGHQAAICDRHVAVLREPPAGMPFMVLEVWVPPNLLLPVCADADGVIRASIAFGTTV